MISPWTIYWLGVLESLQSTIFIILSVFTIVLVIHGINELTKDSEERKDINILKKGIIIWLVMIFVISFIPSKETVKKMYLIDNPTSKMTLEVLEAVKE
nr:MAG TPA: hypothetical protein [Caudoviricetes sp.]